MISRNLLPHFEILTIEAVDYLSARGVVSSPGWSGAKIYDALLLRCAEKCGADRIYTFNLVDFRQLAQEEIRAKICMP